MPGCRSVSAGARKPSAYWKTIGAGGAGAGAGFGAANQIFAESFYLFVTGRVDVQLVRDIASAGRFQIGGVELGAREPLGEVARQLGLLRRLIDGSDDDAIRLDADLGVAYAKSQMAANSPLPLSGKVFISVSDSHKGEVAAVARQFSDLGFELVATRGTAAVLEKAGLKVRQILKLLEGRPNVIDLLKNKEIQFVINTPSGAVPREDEIKIRTTAVYTGTPITTTLSGAKAAALGIAALKKSGYSVKTVQEYH